MAELKLNYKMRRDVSGYLFVLPALAIFGLFKIWPMIWGGYISLHNWDGFGDMTFIGLENYRQMLTEDTIFPKVIRNTLTYAVGIVAGNIAVGLMLALLVNRGLKGRTIFRTIYFLPPIMSFVMVGLLWAWIYNPQFGFVNSFLSSIGLDSLRQSWLSNPKTALPALIVIDVWKWSGWHMVIYLAGLQTISGDVTDAASVDGATGFKRFRFITFPLLKSYTFMNIILITVGAFNTFDLVYVTTRGGPFYATHMLLTYVHLVAFRYRKIGYSAAMTYFLFIIVFGISIINMIVWRRREGLSRQKRIRRGS
jgi:raffinose/stachyose/melibiose transport system permease protein